MTYKLRPSVARVSARQGRPVGVGFLYSARHVLTCAHVVAQALDVAQDSPEPPAAPVVLDFPLLAPGGMVEAHVVAWHPVGRAQGAGLEDIAVLELGRTAPEGARPVRFVDAPDPWGHSFRAIGFPAGYDEGVWASGLIRAVQADGWLQIEDVKAQGYAVAPGYSGTPVWDDQLDGVIGMVVMAERKQETKAAFVIPAEVLRRSLPEEASAPDDGAPDEAPPARIFISYKRADEVRPGEPTPPDESVAMQVYEALSRRHEVFVDQRDMYVGEDWARRIDEEIRRADFLITFLSPHSVRSEMVEREVKRAYHLAKVTGGRPATLPVRVAFRDPLHYPLSAYLNHINWALWEGPGDTPKLIEKLEMAIQRGNLLKDSSLTQHGGSGACAIGALPYPSAPMNEPGGTVGLDSSSYVARQSDETALTAIRKPGGVTIVIKGPRQVGKSSLLVRLKEAAAEAGKCVVFIDFQIIDQRTLRDVDTFFQQFCSLISFKLKLEDRVEKMWRPKLGNKMSCTNYMEDYVLPGLAKPLVLAMDEVERLFETDYRSEFFSMLRSWHNSRADTPIWKRLDLALVTSTEPHLFITRKNESPFNVAQPTIRPEDFTRAEVGDLARRHGIDLGGGDLDRLMSLLGGHPYLVRRALYLVATKEYPLDELFGRATEDRGPFGDHLHNYLLMLQDQEELVRGLSLIIQFGACDDEEIVYRLEGAGLIQNVSGTKATPRCELYASYFGERFNVNHQH